jgi:hypothetical protein
MNYDAKVYADAVYGKGELAAWFQDKPHQILKRAADDLAELQSKLDSETNRANHEERLRRTAETCAGSMSKSLEDEIRNNAALALEADHQRKCAKEWFDRMQAAECRLSSVSNALRDLLAKSEAEGWAYSAEEREAAQTALGVVERPSVSELIESAYEVLHKNQQPAPDREYDPAFVVERRDGK